MGIYSEAAQDARIKNTRLDRLFNNKIFRLTAMGLGLVVGVVLGYARILENDQLFEIGSVILVIYLSPLLIMYTMHLWKIDRVRKAKYKEKKRLEKEANEKRG